jgi:hypothetical protein
MLSDKIRIRLIKTGINLTFSITGFRSQPNFVKVPETDIGNARSCGRLVVTKERKGVPTDCRLLPDYRAICLYNKSP